MSGSDSRPVPVVTPCPLKESWVEFCLLDADGNPRGGYRYVIKVGDRVERGTLPDSGPETGKVRVEGIKPGPCTVSLPDLDSGAWDRI